jgi:hypothetical protein
MDEVMRGMEGKTFLKKGKIKYTHEYTHITHRNTQQDKGHEHPHEYIYS